MREIIAVRGLSKRFGEVVALRDLTFTLEGPQIIGVLGPNGAGKTTLLDILEGLASPSEGEVRLFGAPIAPYPRARVGVVLQREMLLDRVTVREHAELFAAIYGVANGEEEILHRASLGHRANVPVTRLSGGEAQRLFIATAAVHRPALLFLDEPTAHLDPENKQQIGAMLREMGKERTVVLTTHDLREADALCDYLLFLVDGRVRAEGRRDTLVAAVPGGDRGGHGVEDAFFHFCSLRLLPGGEAAERAP
ncbi:MAG: ABC transporter ATP-binding protein [Byssovorax sp.]